MRRLWRGTNSLRETWRHRRAKRRRTSSLARRTGAIGTTEYASCLAPYLYHVGHMPTTRCECSPLGRLLHRAMRTSKITFELGGAHGNLPADVEMAEELDEQAGVKLTNATSLRLRVVGRQLFLL